jgi:hypothetical protein
MIGAVGQERRRAHSRRLFSLAAAVVAFAVLGVGAAFAGGQWFGPGTGGGGLAQPRPSIEPLAPPNGGGGPNLAGERLGATDSRTGVRADVAFEPKDWGTQVDFSISNIKGPKTCRLVAIRSNGQQEVLTTWKVGEKGWGTAAQPQAPPLQAGTALPRSEIAFVQVQSLDASGATENLVTVP